MSRLVSGARWALIGAAAAYWLFLLLLTLRLVAGDAVIGGATTGFVGPETYLLLPQSLLFRRAVGNTVVTTLVALPLALLAAGGLSSRLQFMRTSAVNRRALLLSCGLLPLITPAVCGILGWRILFQSMGAPLTEPDPALLLIGIVLAWRAMPFALLALLMTAGRTRWVRYGSAAAAVVYWCVADAATVLLLTGGEPTNGTHTLASWTYVTAISGGLAGFGAAMATVLWAPLLIALLFLNQWTPASSGLDGTGTRRSEQQGAVVTLLQFAAAAWVLLPFAALAWQAGRPTAWVAALRISALETAYGRILLWTLLVVCLAALTAFVVMEAGRSVSSGRVRRRWLNVGLTTVALWLLPTAFVPLILLQATRFGKPIDVLLWQPETLYVATALSLGYGASTFLRQSRRTRIWDALICGMIGLVIVAQETSSVMALDTVPSRLFNSAAVANTVYRTDLAASIPAFVMLCSALLFALVASLLLFEIERRS